MTPSQNREEPRVFSPVGPGVARKVVVRQCEKQTRCHVENACCLIAFNLTAVVGQVERTFSVLADLNEVAVGITARSSVKKRSFVAPFSIAGPDVGDTQIKEAIYSIQIRRCFKKDSRLIGSRATAGIENSHVLAA
jgi:hypothetical protein